MCGRFVGFRNIEELKRFFPIDRAECEVAANFNVAPTQPVLGITRKNGKNVLARFHWGLVPHWAKDTAIGYKMINARLETVASKPAFRQAFKKRRCLIPADGFYEWKQSKGKKQPVYITLPQKKPLAFAGLWESWSSGQTPDGPAYHSCTIITCEASAGIRPIHARMPLVLQPDAFETWLDTNNQDPDRLHHLVRSFMVTDFVFHPVSSQVNSARVNDPSNIKPVQTEFDF